MNKKDRMLWQKDAIGKLYQYICDRKSAPPRTGSYTCSLLKSGIHRIGSKIIEESEELVEASSDKGKKEIIWEFSDLIYHMLVLLAYHDLTLNDINKELYRRHLKKQKKH